MESELALEHHVCEYPVTIAYYIICVSVARIVGGVGSQEV